MIYLIKNERDRTMSKDQNTKKGAKKEAAKTMKEKKADKREKKDEKRNSGLLNQLHN